MPPTLAANSTSESLTDVTGVILAGGRSRRMGRDKATLPVDGQALFERVLGVLQPLFPAILIAGDRPDLCRPQVPCVPDLYPGSALGGLYTALQAAATPFIFVVACDMPFADPQLIRAILARREGHDVVVPRTPSGLEPLFALYGKECLMPMRALLEAGRFRIYDFFPQVRVRYLDSAELPDGWERSLLNVNTPGDIRQLIRPESPGATADPGKQRKK